MSGLGIIELFLYHILPSFFPGISCLNSHTPLMLHTFVNEHSNDDGF